MAWLCFIKWKEVLKQLCINLLFNTLKIVLFTTSRPERRERRERVEWILMDSFGFPEIISSRMYQRN